MRALSLISGPKLLDLAPLLSTFFGVLRLQLLEVENLPTNGRQISRLWQFDGFKIWFAIMERQQEAHGVVVEPCKKICRHFLSRGFQLIEADGLCRHSLELRYEGLF